MSTSTEVLLTETDKLNLARYKRMRENAVKNTMKYLRSHREMQRKHSRVYYNKHKNCPIFREKENKRKREYTLKKRNLKKEKEKLIAENDVININEV